MRRTLRFLAIVAVATASGYVAFLLVSFLLFQWPRLFLALFTAIEFEGFEAAPRYWLFSRGFIPRAVTRFPFDGSPALFALYQASFFLWGVGFAWLATGAGRRTPGWRRLFCLQSVFWFVVLVLLYSRVFFGWGRSPLVAALRALGPGWSEWPGVRLLAGIGIAALLLPALYVSTRSFLDSAAGKRLERFRVLAHWLVVPVALAAVLINLYPLRYWNLRVAIVVLGPGVILLLVGLAAVLRQSRPAPPLQASLTGAVVLLLIFGVTFGATLGDDYVARWGNRAHLSEVKSRHWHLHFEEGAPPGRSPAAFARAADERVAVMAQRLGLKPVNPFLRAYLYTSADTKRALAGNDEAFTLKLDRDAVHHLLAPDGSLTDPRGDALVLLHAVWGQAGSDAVAKALARYAVGNFQGLALADYAARISREEQPYALRQIFGLDGEYLSPIVRDALGGAWVEFVVEQRGQEILSSLYQTPLEAGEEEEFARGLGSSWEQLEGDWQRYLGENAEGAAPVQARARRAPFYHRGLSFSHEFGGEWGYGSAQALKELERIRGLGANAIAVVPYAFSRAPRETHIYFATDESNDRVVRTLTAAQQLGLATMLKPQLWGGGFTGNIAFESETEFEEWFGPYRRWLLHYARLAELYQVDLLVVGTELGGVTGREAVWRDLIRDLRRIYSGRLTYAANWGEEFETLPFWDALDYLGVNMYYPLAAPGETPRPDSPRVQALVERFAALARKHNKPVLFTEVGYPSVTGAAAEPWKETSAALDVELQARCYATIFEAFSRQPWFAGMYWWKWPSHGRGTPYDASYNPIGKPAAEVLARWYGEAAAR